MAGRRRRRQQAERKLAQEAERAGVAPPRCGALKRNGEPCGRPAGWGTDHVGVGACKHHGGATPSHEQAMVRREVHGMASAHVVTPGEAMAGVLHLAAGQLMYVTSKVAGLPEDELFIRRKAEVIGEDADGNEIVTYEMIPNHWVAFQQHLMERTARLAKLAADAGINERMADLAEQQTRMVASLIEDVADDLSLTPEQRKELGPAVRRRLTLIQGGQPPDVEQAA